MDAHQLDYAVLMAHVLIYEDLCDVLGLRLRTNTLPKRMPTFEVVKELALAGSQFDRDRETLTLLNEARNKVVHFIDRSPFEDKAREFAERSCNDESVAYRVEGFEWPQEEKGKVENSCYGFFVWQAKLIDLKSQFEQT